MAAEQQLSALQTEFGNMREDIGELRGESKAMTFALARLEAKIDSNQITNVATHRSQDAAIATLDRKIATQTGEDATRRHYAAGALGIIGGVLGAGAKAIFDWFTAGNAPHH